MKGREHRLTCGDDGAQTAAYRRADPEFARWAAGCGVIGHSDLTQLRVREMAARLHGEGAVSASDDVFRLLAAADRLASAAMWLVVHMTYARNVYLDGRELSREDFKTSPEGHTGGSLNMVPAYAGYLAANAISAVTRSWLMGQGHCVSAIDASNLLVGNMTKEHAERYGLSDPGLTRFVRDFYSYAVRPDGRPDSPLGSHVNAHTAGGMMEGGYLGFAELQYPHMPLPGETLVTFLSDGAFEEQRGSDWVPRWWRAQDSGCVLPFMILNGRRIDQRSSMAMKGGSRWLSEHLRLHGFNPVAVDGRDPASFAWAIIEMETQLRRSADAISSGVSEYPVPIPYGIAETVKGYGFPGAGSNRAHNLPLRGMPAEDSAAAEEFNRGVRRLWVPLAELNKALGVLNHHQAQGRPRERDHPLADRRPATPNLPEPPWRDPGVSDAASPMRGIDAYFCAIAEANPGLRLRVGNPDEMRSNRLDKTLDLLKHRVTHPEDGTAEDIHGKVITVLNEEAVVSAALANKGGLNLVASYEAFAVKMLGAIRQELIFARQQREAGRPAGWLGLPVIATSHTWENGKNEQSHQDPTFGEALLGEMSDVARVVFPADWNGAVAALRSAYSSHGQIWALVIPKGSVPLTFDAKQAQYLAENGAIRLRGSGGPSERLQLVATGAYQLTEVLKASGRLAGAGIHHSVVYLQEPGRFRRPRDPLERKSTAPPALIEDLFPATASVRVFLTHTRPEPYAGVIWPLLSQADRSAVLGYINHGGTLDRCGMQFANGCTWAHVLAAAVEALGQDPQKLLSEGEFKALNGEADPAAIIACEVGQDVGHGGRLSRRA